jgi:Superfamily II DNA and RNA helicases
MPEEQQVPAVATIGRNPGVVYLLPHTSESIPEFLRTTFEQIDQDSSAVQALILTDDAESAVAMSETAHRMNGAAGIEVLPATGSGRTGRLLKSRPVRALAGTPREVLELVAGSQLKLTELKVLVIAWLEDILDHSDQLAALESLLADAGKDAERIIVIRKSDTRVDEFIERYARRARRVTPKDELFDIVTSAPPPLKYVTTSALSKPATLRRLLDELDPPSAAVVVRSSLSEVDARQALRTLGYTPDDENVHVTVGAPEGTVHTIVFYDAPVRRSELAKTAKSKPVSVLTLAEPSEIAPLRELFGDKATPFNLGTGASKLKKRDDAMRKELRSVLSSGIAPREIAPLEPLLAEYDAVEIAAAALQLLERERRLAKSQPSAAAPAEVVGPRGALPGGPSAKLFVTIGDQDGVKPGDLLGTIAGESGISGDRIGKIDMYDKHSIVEVPADEAEKIIAAVSGKVLRGRTLVVRADRPKSERADRPERAGSGFDRPRRPSGDRPRSGGPASDRPRSDKPYSARPRSEVF